MTDISDILLDNLTEKEAFIFESKMITLLGTKHSVLEMETWLNNIKGGLLLNIDIPKRPDFYDKYFGKFN